VIGSRSDLIGATPPEPMYSSGWRVRNLARPSTYSGSPFMESWTSDLAQHGYAILFASIFLESVGLPVPAALALLIAGAAAAHGSLQAVYAIGGAILAMLAGDTVMFLLGRHTGWWLLGLLCRISLNPESCILRSASSFHRRGRKLLLIAKFIPGINTMAPPLAGSMNMRLVPFLRLDLVGAALYIGFYFGLGFAFSGALIVITRGYHMVGRVLAVAVAALIVGYVSFQCWLWLKSRKLRAVSYASPSQVAGEMLTGADIYDVRSHGYFDAQAVRIKGSKRLDPHTLDNCAEVFRSNRRVYLYCTCVREATSARVARELESKLSGREVGIAVIKGGLRAWQRAGLSVEVVPLEDVAALPVFD
jgi:membrane protein DedA with SNARE-associated domain/rhodanese-related sulfurtransferase